MTLPVFAYFYLFCCGYLFLLALDLVVSKCYILCCVATKLVQWSRAPNMGVSFIYLSLYFLIYFSFLSYYRLFSSLSTMRPLLSTASFLVSRCHVVSNSRSHQSPCSSCCSPYLSDQVSAQPLVSPF
jgi:hypothetical protein